MAKPYLVAGSQGSTGLTSSYQVIATGQSLGSVLTQLSVHSSDSDARTLTLATGEAASEKVICVISVPIGAGNSVNQPALDLLNQQLLPGENTLSGRIRRLGNGEKLNAKIDSGTSVTLHWTRLDYSTT